MIAMKQVLFGGLALSALAGGLVVAARQSEPTPLITFSTSLTGRTDAQRHNAALAVRKLNGALIKPGGTFSFNGRIGTYSRDTGYRRAPVSFNGQLISAWGGGVCQTSTTFYNAALRSGFDILERHAHQFAPLYVQPGLDSAVAYPGIDLRVRNPYPFAVRVVARIDGDSLIVRLEAQGQKNGLCSIEREVRQVTHDAPKIIGEGSATRIRNTGKTGFDVSVYRIRNGKREWISSDSYPSMAKVIERS
jgi:vancomycin resistance protein YoaR